VSSFDLIAVWPLSKLKLPLIPMLFQLPPPSGRLLGGPRWRHWRTAKTMTAGLYHTAWACPVRRVDRRMAAVVAVHIRLPPPPLLAHPADFG